MKDLNSISKIDLHLHLDGSLDVDNIKKLYNLDDSKINELMVAPNKCNDLNDYLKRFTFPISILQTKEELEAQVKLLLNRLKKDNVIYAEIRFAPQFHTKKGLTQKEVVEIVLEAKKQVDIKCNFILCFMRGSNNMDANYETLEVAKYYFNKGVCAVDLAGAEGLYPTRNYRDLFKKTSEYGIPFTIHAGEADGCESINDAISFGAKRIGHGVRAIEDEKIIELIKQKNIFLEICPKSNIQTGICGSYQDHPLEKLYLSGIKTTINTDNMTVSNTFLEEEYENIINYTNLNIEDIIKMNLNSIEASFLSFEEKQNLYKYFN